MRGKWVVRGAIGVLLIIAIGGFCWLLIPSERLIDKRAVQILDFQREKNARGYWLDAQTLLLVTGNFHSDRQKVQGPTPWNGSIQRLDLRSSKRSPEPGLTQMVNSLGNPDGYEPLGFAPAPGGEWLLWYEVAGPRNYLSTVMSTRDGNRYYGWASHKFEDKYWVNSHQWVHHRKPHMSLADQAEIKVLDLFVDDVHSPTKEQELPTNSAQARALITGSSPDGKEYDLESQKGSELAAEWYLAVYDVYDYHLSANSRPLRKLPLKFPPFDNISGDVSVSPNHHHVAYTLQYEQGFPLQTWLHRHFSFIPASKQQKMRGVWGSRSDGSNLHEIGHLAATDQNDLQDFQWLSDNQHVSWSDTSGLYVVTTE